MAQRSRLTGRRQRRPATQGDPAGQTQVGCPGLPRATPEVRLSAEVRCLGWSKNDNWLIAGEMTTDELAGTDLETFIEGH
jgi:hypothetical protein